MDSGVCPGGSESGQIRGKGGNFDTVAPDGGVGIPSLQWNSGYGWARSRGFGARSGGQHVAESLRERNRAGRGSHEGKGTPSAGFHILPL
jgi:hypothetical protein